MHEYPGPLAQTLHWEDFRVHRDKTKFDSGSRGNPEIARNALTGTFHPVLTGVPESAFAELVDNLLRVLTATNHVPAGLGKDDKKAAKRESLKKSIVKTAPLLGDFNPKGVDANAGGQGSISPRIDDRDPATGTVSSINTHVRRGLIGNTQTAAYMSAYKFLRSTFFDDKGNRWVMIEELGDPSSPFRKAVLDEGFSEEQLNEAARAYANTREDGRTPDELIAADKQIQWPLGDDQYRAITPVPNDSFRSELLARLAERRERVHYPADPDNNQPALRTSQDFDIRDYVAGGTQPQNAGVLAVSNQGSIPALRARAPRSNAPDRRASAQRTMREGTVFPRRLLRELYRSGAVRQLHAADENLAECDNARNRLGLRRACEAVAARLVNRVEAIRWLDTETFHEVLQRLPVEERGLFAYRRNELTDAQADELSIPDFVAHRETLIYRAINIVRQIKKPVVDYEIAKDLFRRIDSALQEAR